MFVELELLDKKLYQKIKTMKKEDWTEAFANDLYKDIKKRKYFITNLGKCTQTDARPLKDSVYKQYLHLLKQEFKIIQPKVIILFGNQVSSIVLERTIKVGKVRKKCFDKEIDGKNYKFYAVHYPIGNGRYNLDKSIEDIEWIMKKELSKT